MGAFADIRSILPSFVPTNLTSSEALLSENPLQLCSLNLHDLGLDITNQSKIFISWICFILKTSFLLWFQWITIYSEHLKRLHLPWHCFVTIFPFPESYIVLHCLLNPIKTWDNGLSCLQVLDLPSSHIRSWPWPPYFLIFYHSAATRDFYRPPSFSYLIAHATPSIWIY